MTENLIELGLRNENDSALPEGGDPTPASKPDSLADRLLGLISQTAVESDTLNTDQFRSRLKHYREQLENADVDSADGATIAADCLRLCQEYLLRTRHHFHERESEFAEVINLMRMALGKLAGDATAFNVKLTDSSERLGRLSKIEDIRELKKRISQEVHELNRVVTEKQKQDEQTYSKLNNRIETLQENLTKSKHEAAIDPLTSVANRGAFDKALEQWVASHRKNQTPFVLAMFDIDNFKLINDAHGHQVGDRVLLCVAQWLRKYVRSTDCVARYGGEEFVIMLGDTNLTDAEVRFKELLGNMAKSSYAYEKDGAERVVAFTASCGLAEFSSNESGEDLLRRADEALYQAKKTGKNRVVPSKRQKNFWKTLSSALPRPNKT